MEVKAEYLAIFSEEASDQLREWEECLLALEKSPGDKEPLNNMFRAIHTLKGSAGFIGFDGLQKMAHDLESSLSSVRDGVRPYDGALGDLLFKGLDLARGDDRSSSPTAKKEAAPAQTWTSTGSWPGSLKPPARPRQALPPRLPRRVGQPPRAVPQKAPDRKRLPRLPPATAHRAGACGRPPRVRSRRRPEAAGPPITSRLVVRIEGQNREAYLRSCLVKARLDRLGTIAAMDPSPEVLRESIEPFVYTVTISSAMDAAALCSALEVDQVAVAPAPAAPLAASEETEHTAAGETPREGAHEVPLELSKATRPDEVVRVSVQKLDTLLNLVGELVIHNSGFVATTQQLREQYGKTQLHLRPGGKDRGTLRDHPRAAGRHHEGADAAHCQRLQPLPARGARPCQGAAARRSSSTCSEKRRKSTRR